MQILLILASKKLCMIKLTFAVLNLILFSALTFIVNDKVFYEHEITCCLFKKESHWILKLKPLNICLRDGSNQVDEFTEICKILTDIDNHKEFLRWGHIIMTKWENRYYKDKGDGLQCNTRRNLMLKLCLVIKINKQHKKQVVRLFVVRVVKLCNDMRAWWLIK